MKMDAHGRMVGPPPGTVSSIDIGDEFEAGDNE
jgi:hypothetical protein